MSTGLELGVVDQAIVRKGGTAGEALRDAIELAGAVERFGYTHYWVAEHHSLGVASTSPEILIGQIAAATERIRVGSGGVMLPHYSAFKVAENFRMLESLFPGRIDIGLGRAPGGDQRTAAALVYPGNMRDVRLYPEQVDDLIGYLSDDLPEGHPFAGVKAGATPGRVPDIWLLGSGVDSAMIAADRGLAFSFAHFFGTAAEHAPAVLEAYRKRFRTGRHYDEPRPHLAVQVVCAESTEEAEFLAGSVEVGRLQAARGTREGSGMLPPEEAQEVVMSPPERAFVEQFRRAHIVGDMTKVCEQIDALARACNTREIGIVTVCYDPAARRRSYELVAQGFGLTQSA
jgi:luciferase family oxidoreductase group 1